MNWVFSKLVWSLAATNASLIILTDQYIMSYKKQLTSEDILRIKISYSKRKPFDNIALGINKMFFDQIAIKIVFLLNNPFSLHMCSSSTTKIISKSSILQHTHYNKTIQISISIVVDYRLRNK